MFFNADLLLAAVMKFVGITPDDAKRYGTEAKVALQSAQAQIASIDARLGNIERALNIHTETPLIAEAKREDDNV